MLEMFTVNSNSREQLIDITYQIKEIVKKSNITSGICYIYTPHTTCGITINENADPDVKRDIIYWLNKMIPNSNEFRHLEGNSDAHIKSSLFGFSQNIIIENGNLILGTWQGIYLAEFDGSRTRKVYVKIIEG